MRIQNDRRELFGTGNGISPSKFIRNLSLSVFKVILGEESRKMAEYGD